VFPVDKCSANNTFHYLCPLWGVFPLNRPTSSMRSGSPLATHPGPTDISRAGLTIREAHTNVGRGPFSHTRTQHFLPRMVYFYSLKNLTTFLVVAVLVTFKAAVHCTFKRQHSVKIWQMIGGTLAAGAPWRRGPHPWYSRHNG